MEAVTTVRVEDMIVLVERCSLTIETTERKLNENTKNM
jgi:hypothetical protein